MIGGRLLHTVTASATTWADTMSFHAFANSLNAGVITACSLYMRTATIYRLGKIETAPNWKHLTTATNTVLKYGAGRLHKCIFNAFANGAIATLYDAVTGTNAIAIINPQNGVFPGDVSYDLDFYTGLTITITGTVDLTIVYE